MWNARNARAVRAANRVAEKAASGKPLTAREKKIAADHFKTAPVFNPFTPRAA